MAQLNPNFEIDFSDINSYEQIQLINDTQLAKENLLMHRAYKEPADDAIIRNQFSSFTFVDFCPKLFTLRPSSTAAASGQLSPRLSSSLSNQQSNGGRSSSSLSTRHYELETFSDLFERINVWLKLNKDWRVVSMETLVFDCTSQFNHLKSSIHANNLPRNTRGLRLFLSPSKSRFSGPQKIGCINVVPRKVSGSHMNPDEPVQYETLDQILSRLNELLLTRPIEGRILSVETITLPMVNGYVNTETNYFMDNRLNLLNQGIYMAPDAGQRPAQASSSAGQRDGAGTRRQETVASAASYDPSGSHALIDILRVYYEFGPMVCGLVNLIDFIPRFYSSAPPPPTTTGDTDPGQPGATGPSSAPVGAANEAGRASRQDSHQHEHQDAPCGRPPSVGGQKIAATESLTRLIRRSLSWFEAERKRILAEPPVSRAAQQQATTSAGASLEPVAGADTALNLKVCNLQVHHKIMLKAELVQVTPNNALDRIKTRLMVHKRPNGGTPIVCAECDTSTASHQFHELCSHLVDLSQPYELKFVRLAYVVPVYNKYLSVCLVSPLRARPKPSNQVGSASASALAPSQDAASPVASANELLSTTGSSRSSSSSSCSSSASCSRAHSPVEWSAATGRRAGASQSDEPSELKSSPSDDGDGLGEDSDLKMVEQLLARESAEERSKQAALAIVGETNQLHRAHEEAHQLQLNDDSLNDSPIGQLTYRLFAPCQLVNSSSCFSINPVNSSSPLSRRGSVNLNGTGISSENAHPSSLLSPLGASPSQAGANEHHHYPGLGHQQHQIISFGAFFPALSHDVLADSCGPSSPGKQSQHQAPSSANSRFTTNEFEPVEAIRRRMEVYVTTNSMKIIAGETLIVNLSDALSCLSTAIEQTVVRASFAQRAPSTWVSVYVLYAAVDEPQLPNQLLEQRMVREKLAQISEQEEGANTNQKQDAGEGAADNMVPVFDDDFKCMDPKEPEANNSVQQRRPRPDSISEQEEQTKSGITIEIEPGESSLTLYNSAYDRTVALPTQPDNHLSHYLEPNEFLSSQTDCLWLDENDLIEDQQGLHFGPSPSRSSRKSRREARKASKSKKNRHEDSQCSIM